MRAIPAKQSTRYALQRIDQLGDANLRRIFHQKVDMILLAVAFDKSRTEVVAHPAEDLSKPNMILCIQTAPAAFRDKDQMDMKRRNDMSSLSIIKLLRH